MENQISQKNSSHHFCIWRSRSFLTLYLRIQNKIPDFCRLTK